METPLKTKKNLETKRNSISVSRVTLNELRIWAVLGDGHTIRKNKKKQ